jgi:hypothetical protein
MLLARYFLYVGGALLALLLVVSSQLPQGPVVPSTTTSATDMPSIRINSDRKWPAKVVFDTNAPTIVPNQLASNADVRAPAPPAQAATSAEPREALAQLSPSDLKKSGVKKLEPRLHQKRKMARRYVRPAPMMVAQQPQYGFGFFGNRIW